MEEVNVANQAWDNWDERAFGEEVAISIPTIKHNIWPHTNQGLNTKTKSACTMVGALNQIIRLFWIDLSAADSNKLACEVVDYCIPYGYKVGNWWDTPTAINTVTKRWNEKGRLKFNKWKVFWTKRAWNTKEVKEALSKGHLVWFTYALNYGEDRRKGLVYKNSYPAWWGHRTNWQATKTTKPTGGAKEPTADCGVYDSYYGWTNQYLIRDRSKYMWKWMYTWWYIILPLDNMDMTIDEAKDKVAETKAINYVLGALTTWWANVSEKYQNKFAELAKEMRNDYKDARKLDNNEEKKVGQTLVDAMSYCWKYMPEDIQKDLSSLATKIRTKLDVK